MFNIKQKSDRNNPLKNLLELEQNGFDNNYVKKESISPNEKSSKLPQRKEFTLFSYNQYFEQEVIGKKINELLSQIKQEVELIKKTEKSLINEVKDIENLTIEEPQKKTGVYHIRFLEILLSILKEVRKKVSESKTWLEALMTKKKKPGSLFAARTKKMGTQYSLSQELQTTRSVQ
jgi:uncharacterized coiled-coil protein SlyX